MKKTEMKAMNSNNNAVTAGIFLAGAIAGITITAIGKSIKKLCSTGPDVNLSDDKTEDDMTDDSSIEGIVENHGIVSDDTTESSIPDVDSETKDELDKKSE